MEKAMSEKNKFFFLWYQEPLFFLCEDDWASMIYLFGTKDLDYLNYNKEWVQNCLDFLFRVSTCSICEFEDKSASALDIIRLMAKNYDVENDICWTKYQIQLTEYGWSFIKKSRIIGDEKKISPLFKEKLTNLFDKNGVGFDKKNFVQVGF